MEDLSMNKIRNILIGALALFTAFTSYAENLPVLPAPDQIATLPRPGGFKDSFNQQLDRAAALGRSLQARPVRNRFGDEPLAVVSIDPGLLRAPVSPRVNKQVLALGSRPQPGPLTIQIDNRELRLAWVAEAVDRSGAIRHETMQLLGVPNGYARFSVSGDLIVGTIVTPQAIYRIVPSGEGTQAVFATLATDSAYARSKYALQLPAGLGDSALERRHVQLERLAEIQPEYVDSSEAGRSLVLRGGKLGRITGKADAEQVRAVINSIDKLANAPEGLELRIERISSHGQGNQIEFHQLVKGVPYFALNEMGTDKAGNVVSVRTQFVDPSKAEEASISQSEAQRHAVKAIEDRIKAPLKEFEILKPTELYYYRDASTQRLAPYYTFYLRAQRTDGTWAVHVDATNGSARILENPQEFGWRVCADASSTAHPTSCMDVGADVIWYHTYNHPNGPGIQQCPYRDPGNPLSKCVQTDPAKGANAMNEANWVLHTVQQTNPTVCCDRIGGGDHIVDLIFKTSATTAVAEYNVGSESIQSATNSDYLRNQDVAWHEFGHHVLYKNATSFPFSTTYGTSGEYFTTVFVEAVGDLMTAGITLNARPSTITYGNIGDAWTVGDGGFPPAGMTQRHLDDPNVTSFYHISTASTPHDASRAISKYFYKIYSTSGISAARFLELLIQVTRNISDVDQNHLDLVDLKAALLASVRAGETALSAAITARFDEMYNNIPGVGGPNPPVGVPISTTAPAAPYPLTATFDSCVIVDNLRLTQWRLQWPRPPFATSFTAIVQQINGPLTDTETTTGTLVFVQTNVNASAWVFACSASGSCGGASNIVTVSPRPECSNF
jgi:hypothetical protein